MPVDQMLPLRGYEAEAEMPLDALVARLRRRSPGYVLTSVAHGARVPAVQRTLQALRQLGVNEKPDPARSAHAPLDAIGLSLIRLEPGDTAPAALLLADIDSARWPLLPAVQKVRIGEAVERTPLSGRFLLFAASAKPARAAGKDRHKDWILIESLG